MDRATDLEAIKQLKARYFRLIDTKQWVAWRTLFTDDAQFEGTSRSYAGPDHFCRETAAWMRDAVTVHHGHMPEIVFTGEDTAHGVWAMQDIVQFPAPVATGAYQGMIGFIGHGHYEEDYVRAADGWRIAMLRLTRLRVDPLPADTPFPTLLPGLLRSG